LQKKFGFTVEGVIAAAHRQLAAVAVATAV
jgi:hypothetical protein